jgi:nitrite reductase (NADH) small subunit
VSVQEIVPTAQGTTAQPEPTQPAWHPVCRLSDLLPERGAAALVDGEQVAVIRLLDDRVLAVQNLDPFSGAHVMSRGIVGTRGAVPTLASPMYKQVFDLTTGRCLETAGYTPVGGHGPDLQTWTVTVRDGVVLLGRPGSDSEGGPEGRAERHPGSAA